jgi:hypothetical protein
MLDFNYEAMAFVPIDRISVAGKISGAYFKLWLLKQSLCPLFLNVDWMQNVIPNRHLGAYLVARSSLL